MKKSELRKIIREVISEQIASKNYRDNLRTQTGTGQVNPKVLNVIASRTLGELASNLNQIPEIPKAEIQRIAQGNPRDPVAKGRWKLVFDVLKWAGYILFGYGAAVNDPDLQEQINPFDRTNVSTKSPTKYIRRDHNLTTAQMQRIYNKLGRPNTYGNLGAALLRSGANPQDVSAALRGYSPDTIINNHFSIGGVIKFLIKRGAAIGLGWLLGAASTVDENKIKKNG